MLVDHFSELSQEQLNKVEQESDIEVLFGFRPYDKIDRYFKDADLSAFPRERG